VDSNQFDTLTRYVVSRRTGVGLGLAGLLGLSGPATEAKNKEEALPTVQEAQEGQVQSHTA
jgi:hypothetical protein